MENINVINYGENIKKLRIEKGYTEIQVAAYLKLDIKAYRRIERAANRIRIDYMIMLADLFNVSLSKLILDKE